MAGHILVLTTVASEAEGESIARALVQRRLAACVNITGPVRSIYRWKGEVKDQREHVLLIKTVGEDFDRLKDVLVGLHSYDLPEVIALPIERGLETYLNWLAAASAEPAESV